MNTLNYAPPIVVEPESAQADACVIWLHGLGADGSDFAGLLPELTLPEDHRIRFIFPHAAQQAVTINMGMLMPAWYDISSLALADGFDYDGLQGSVEYLTQLIEQQLALGISPENILLAGFSQGGVVVLHAALQSANKLAGVMALSTYFPAPQAAEKFAEGFPILMAHGEMDNVVPIQLGLESKQRLQNLNAAVEWYAYPMAHQVCHEEIEAINQFIIQRLCYG